MKKLLILFFLLLPFSLFAGGPSDNLIPKYTGEKLENTYYVIPQTLDSKEYNSSTGTISNDINDLIIKKENGNSVVRSKIGNQNLEYNQINEIIYSPDGKHLAYSAFRGSNNVLVIDGKESMEYDGFISNIHFYDDNKSVSFLLLSNTGSENVPYPPQLITYKYVEEMNFFVKMIEAIIAFFKSLFI